MELFKKTTNIDFLGQRKFVMPLTLLFVAVSFFSLATKGLEFGIDFTGGVTLELHFPASADLDQVRGALERGGFHAAQVQTLGSTSDLLVRLPPPAEGVDGTRYFDQVMAALKAATPDVVLKHREFVGPQVGADLANQGTLAAIFALVGIGIYLWARFEAKFALGAQIATVHNVVFTVGWFSIFGLEFDLTVLAAVLAVIGYSVNDTVVVFDRIRENFRTMRKGTPEEVMNRAINETMSRTVMTGSTVIAVLLALFFFGGPVIHNFSIALIVGVVVGTYSSVYIASATALMLGASRDTLMPPKRDEELDALP